MIDLAAYALHHYYGAHHVIDGITFEIFSGEKIGLLGKNGSGKTTLFKIIIGEEPYESGSLIKASGKRVEMLAQIPAFGEKDTVEDILRSSFQEVTGIYTEMKRLEGDATPAGLSRYGRLMEAYERLGGYETEVKLDKVCRGMRISQTMRANAFDRLSGGEKTRVNLARILLRDCDILLLDEPTNHLDLTSIEWLENFLREFRGTVVTISHDRAFLDRVVTRIMEIEDGKAHFYAGNYSFYVEERKRRFLTQAERYKQQQREIGRLEEAIKRQRVWAQINPSNAGLAKRALAMERRIEQMDKVDKPVTARSLSAQFGSGGYAAKEMVSFDCVCKSYGAKALLRDADAKISRYDRIALVGENGCGKTTLLKILMNEERPDSGEIKMSVSAKPAYMPQNIEFENEEATVLETLCLEFGLSVEKARGILAGFHFRADDVLKKVGTLSGGEKSRLKLCILMQRSVNFLLLDEPTNHLDIASREWIENALTDFDGTMLFVSHDRYFLNKFATKVWSMEDGAIVPFEGNFEAYLEARHRKEAAREAAPKKKARRIKQAGGKQAPQKQEAPIETRISDAEAQLGEVNARIEADIAKADFSEMSRLCGEKDRLEQCIEALYREWLTDGD